MINTGAPDGANKNQVEDFLFENFSLTSITFTFTFTFTARSLKTIISDNYMLGELCYHPWLSTGGLSTITPVLLGVKARRNRTRRSLLKRETTQLPIATIAWKRMKSAATFYPLVTCFTLSPSRPAILSGLNAYYMYIVKAGWRSRKRFRKLLLWQ